MKFSQHLPCLMLQPFVKHYVVIETDGEQVNRILPDTAMVMAFRYQGLVSYVRGSGEEALSTAMISGLRRTNRLVHYAKNTGNLLVIFKEAGAQAFIKEPLHELAERSAELDQLQGYDNLTSVQEELALLSTAEQRVGAIERFLCSHLYQPHVDPMVMAAIKHIQGSHGILNIKNLAASLCLSQDAFEKRFRKSAGLSPKQFAGIARMKAIIANGVKQQSLTETAYNAGYFDQSHFNKDFKLFTGQTPSEFLKSPVRW